ncbi:phosphate/phosphite/phosphonate ABC transporter substrate-binding protein [Thiomicrorhabdus sediminis]|uniref:Phosphate/phosphite/phosphonate ABC transporter substrate-binding protein n=1 Tax=Thiomicrorhabdus sediminis TaxID=2580412 RepID=A0A4P9K7B8_9GAMM|nr:phosphate/phosphite/phosphonate ABC transporter substrate-binding protein [Thiomicrorhabdus sediminis]QCU90828.1 phosphate/phosphite/phosphonate ABC transporter substrate-binding protein [Thiomicrorhabdus sediminis]
MRILALLFSITFLLSACSDQNDNVATPKLSTDKKLENIEYRFAIHPLHNPTRLFDVFNPLMDYLNARMPGVTFKVEASRNYAAFDDKLVNAEVPFALPNPYQTLLAIDSGYHVIAKMGDDENFKGIILVRKDSNIESPLDLKGKTVSYPAPTALAATILPQYYLQKHGLDINKDISNKYVGSQESSIMNVFLGTTAAGATWPPPWKALSEERPELKKQLKVIWQTQSLPNNSVVVRNDVNPEHAEQVRQLLSTLHTTVEGKQILAGMYLSKYELADNATYSIVRNFTEEFSRTIRPLQ